MATGDIQHVVVLMLENRSFDHFLGDLSLGGKRTDVNGLSKGLSNPGAFGGTVPIKAVTNERFITDGGHTFSDVQDQLKAENGIPNQGFVRNYAKQFKTEREAKKYAHEIMHYQTAKTVPVHYLLADEYAISDTWFCSVPSETWPNRIFTAAATTNGRLKNGLPLYELETIYSRLADKGLTWAVYNDQLPNVINIEHMAGEFVRSRHKPASRFRSMVQFESDCAQGKLPAYSFIEPVYFFSGANDDHPPHDISKGQALIAQVYLAIRRNEALWKKTVLLITDDEHGGFYDHVPTPQGAWIPAPATTRKPDFDFDFHQLGPRVPMILVSPWTAKRSVFRSGPNEYFDHTSIIRSVALRFGLKPLTARDKGAKDFWSALTEKQPRTDDTATFKKIEALYAQLKPIGLESVEEGEAVGLSGQQVAALISTKGRERSLEAVGEVYSEFQLSMEQLADEIAANAQTLRKE